VDILVPTDKPHIPHPTGAINLVRTLAIFGWVGYVLFFSMVFSEGDVSFPHLQRTVQLVAVGFGGFLLSWRFQRLGGLILVASMVVALVLTPSQLREWRLYFYLLEGYMAVLGILLVVLRRKISG
jgi:hypothetical protein